MIGIDAGSLPDPYIQPALPGVVVTPRPGVATRVLLPMAAAGEIEGVLRRDGGNPIEGLRVEPVDAEGRVRAATLRSEEHTSELQSLMRISYAVFCLKKKKTSTH